MFDVVDGFDHINRNAPVLIRTPKLTRFEPAQYMNGGLLTQYLAVKKDGVEVRS